MSTESLTFPLLPRRRVSGLSFGAMRSRTRGSGLDLAGSRPYRPGDDIRRIDWRASGRLSSARDSDELVVREHITEEATRVVLVVDRSPSMALYPEGLPWLSKPTVICEVGDMILESALQAGCLVGYLDDADGRHPMQEKRSESPFWRQPGSLTEPWRLRERYLPYPGFHAPPGTVDELVGYLLAPERQLPFGAFVFVVSDFVSPPGEAWEEALVRGLDVVPVLVSDATWERSFPDVAGVLLPFCDAGGRRLSPVRLTRREVRDRRAANEARFEDRLARFDELGAPPVVLSSAERGDVLGAFLDWADGRHYGARLAR